MCPESPEIRAPMEPGPPWFTALMLKLDKCLLFYCTSLYRVYAPECWRIHWLNERFIQEAIFVLIKCYLLSEFCTFLNDFKRRILTSYTMPVASVGIFVPGLFRNVLFKCRTYCPAMAEKWFALGKCTEVNKPTISSSRHVRPSRYQWATIINSLHMLPESWTKKEPERIFTLYHQFLLNLKPVIFLKKTASGFQSPYMWGFKRHLL